MTEQEALKYLKDASRTNDMLCIFPKSDIGKCLIKALEEIQQYRAIGTVNEFKSLKENWLNKFDSLIEYRKIGTPEECLAAVDKKEVRNKAIDDFAETCKQDVMCQTFGLHPRNIDEIAEQLKGGGVDD